MGGSGVREETGGVVVVVVVVPQGWLVGREGRASGVGISAQLKWKVTEE